MSRAVPPSFPSFLGIGAPKAGTTWLQQVLESHPDILMSKHRKEIHYFDLHFERGPAWYGRFFRAAPGHAPTAVGEFTTHYLYGEEVPARVRTVPTIERFVVILRNPVDRAFSHFRFRRRQDNVSGSFEDFLAAEPHALSWGRYGGHLARWFGEFDRSQFLVLIYEDAVQDPPAIRRQLAQHLGVVGSRFPERAGHQAVNEAFVPRRAGLYAAAVRQARWLRRHDLDRLITLAKRSGAVRALKRPADDSGPEDVTPSLRERLWEEVEDDVIELEALLGTDLSIWRPTAA